MPLHDILQNQYELEGFLVAETALHIGTGQSSPTTDAGVIRDYQRRPFIPGSSLKGALRSAVERRTEWLGLHSCKLQSGYATCLSTNGVADEQWRQRPLHDRLQDLQTLCDTCQLFGSVHCAAKVQVDDLSLAQDFDRIAPYLVEMRDGVGIDRDSGTAADGVKFDYEVVPSMTAFQFYLTAENLEPSHLALLSLGLLEMMNGTVPLGGKHTRGLGRCRLYIEHLYHVDFSRSDTVDTLALGQRLLDHLKPRQDRKQDVESDARAFLLEAIQHFMKGQQGA